MKLDMAYFPVFAIMSFAIGTFVSGILYFLPRRAAITAGAAVTVITAAVFVIECICRDILQQYYQIFSALDTAAGNRLTDYSSAVIQSVSENAAGILLMLAVPVVLLIISFKYSGNEETIRKAAGIIVLCLPSLSIWPDMRLSHTDHGKGISPLQCCTGRIPIQTIRWNSSA